MINVRSENYYGGDLYVEADDDENASAGAARIVWNAWGGYGGARIATLDAAETRKLASALLQVAGDEESS